MTVLDQDTIAAIATASGKGGVGIVRLSGKKSLEIAKAVTGKNFKPRYAHYCDFFESNNKNLLDSGIAIYFNSPHSFTGEDIVELQGHGGPVILDAILNECVRNGARLARPGEFSERAFLNDKIDLVQAEAIADLIDSASIQAARNAVRSLQGDFSNNVNALVEKVIALRVYVEAAIDFPDEEIDFLNDGHVKERLQDIIDQTRNMQSKADQGRILREGMNVVIAGKPNAGKSSLMNALAGYESAIVTDIEGTTRDILKEQILIDGMPLHIIDTAGLRDSPDVIEKEGIKRAWEAIETADAVLLVMDASKGSYLDTDSLWPEFRKRLKNTNQLIIINNKCDLTGNAPTISTSNTDIKIINLSAKEGKGIDLLRKELKDMAGFNQQEEGGFIARRRHLDAIEKALGYLLAGMQQLQEYGAGELLAEDLRYCQQQLNHITGEFSSDDLLGEIFSSFCIGK